MQVHHVCNTEYSPLQSKLYWLVVVTCVVVLSYSQLFPQALEMTYVVYALLSVFVFC